MTAALPPDPPCPGCGGPVARSRGPAGSARCGVCAELSDATAAPPGRADAAEHDATLVGSSTIRMKPIVPPGGGTRPNGSAGRWPAGLMLTLEVVEGPARGLVYRLRQRSIVIGREEGQIRIPDAMISRRHASLEVVDPETIILKDLASTNGTYHNNDLIAFSKLADGDEIRIGATVITVSMEVAAGASAGGS